MMLLLRKLAQAARAQAPGAVLRHRQPHALLRAPARALRIAAEHGSAGWTANVLWRGGFFPICHAKSRKFAAVLMWGSSPTALPCSTITIAAQCA